MRLSLALAAALTVAIAPTANAQTAPPPAAARTALHAARALDVDSGRMLHDAWVVVDGDRIASIGEGGAAPAGAKVVELGDVTLLPGLIDVHVHLTGDPTTSTGNYYQDALMLGPMDQAVVAPTLAKRTLDAGFTTVRNVGAGDYIDVALRNAIDRGQIAVSRRTCASRASPASPTASRPCASACARTSSAAPT